MSIYLIYLAVGAFAGLLAGLFGVGGGLIIVAALVVAFKSLGISPDVLVHLAVGTSLATIIPTSLSSSYTHHQKKGVLWSWFKFIAVGMILGSFFGAYIASKITGFALQKIIGVFVLLVSAQMILKLQPKPRQKAPSNGVLVGAGGVIGWASAIFGIGGGTLSVPFLVWSGAAMRQAAGTSAALGFPIAVFGAFGYLVNGYNQPFLPDYSIGYIYLPALIGITLASVPTARLGAKLAHFLPELVLKRLFVLMMILVGLNLVFF